ncbi:MAG: glycoside hydrolase family 127 protein [Lachnospiraceae bacterium]|nr:glycoside hydrolase family 127 protein [Lachnospiraceae bacterium]
MAKRTMRSIFKRGTAILMLAALFVCTVITTGLVSTEAEAETASSDSTNSTSVEESTVSTETGDLALAGSEAFDLGTVVITDDYLTNSFDLEIAYLTSFDTDKLLAGFRETAGLDMNGATRYSGWENSLIGGHAIGHYMSAIAQAYASLQDGEDGKDELYDICVTMIDGLKECQDAVGTGFIFAAKVIDSDNIEIQFDNVEAGKTDINTQAWVPWYTMHKILAGLIDIYNYTGYDDALTVAEALGDWVYNRVSGWSTATQNTVLGIEYGGMNDVMYQLYGITGNENYAIAAHMFDEETLFEKVLADQDDVLNNLHANCTIPKFIGALQRYILCDGKTIDGEVVDASKYLEYAEAFWTMVIEKHTYVTGGNSEWEHFGEDYVLDGERTQYNDETCNTYNMLKLTRALFMLTGDVKYSDYYENAFINAIVASQNPETGMTMYFQPMATGYFKVYSTEYTNFWCCTGSGMENFTKLSDSIYFKKDNILIVNQYISTVLTWADENVKVTQETDIPYSDTATFTVNLTGGSSADIDIYLRLPDWLADDAVITVNGATYSYETVDNYAVVSGPFADGDTIEIELPMEIVAYNLPDGENTYAFKYGPIVLAALLGDDDMSQTTTGVSVSVPASKSISSDYTTTGTDTINILNGSTVEEFIENINDNLVMTGSDGTLEWTLTNTDANLTFVPHYSQYEERYGIYWTLQESGSDLNVVQYLANKTASRLEANLLDTVQPGYGQYEDDELHSRTDYDNGSEGSMADTTRYALAGGSFSYRMIVDPDEDTSLLLTLAKADNGKTLKISVGDTVIYEETLAYSGSDATYQVEIPISSDVISANAEDVTVTDGTKTVCTFVFESADENDSARLMNFVYTIHSFGTDTSLTVTTDDGTVTANGTDITVDLNEDASEATWNMEIGDEYGYVTVDGSVVDNTATQTVQLNGKYTNVTVVVYAEDHTTTAEYTVQFVTPGEGVRANVDETLAYFVDCGDHDPTTLSDGDLYGTHNSVTEQIYGVDPETGYTWGVVDDTNDQYGGSSISAGVYTANTWCYEYATDDGQAKEETNRYTKNQYESGMDRDIEYAFELENGTYTVEVCFTDPWSCSNNPTVTANAGKDSESIVCSALNLSTSTTATAEVTVTDGELTLSFTTTDLCINLCYIKIGIVSVDEEETEAPTTTEAAEDAEETDAPTTTAADEEESSGNGAVIAVVVIVIAVIAAVVVYFLMKKKKNGGNSPKQ